MMSDPLLFVPGLMCTEALFAPQIAAFKDRPIMVADHRQHDRISDIAAAILEKAPERFSLIGLSMGGYIAMEIMREAPGRVSKLALLDTKSRADTPEQSERRSFLIELTRKRGFAKVPHLLFPGFVHEKNEENVGLKSIVVEMANDTGPDAFIRQQTAILHRIDSRQRLGEIDCPTLVMVGDGDRLTPPALSREIHERIPTSELEVIPGSGHLTTLETPEAVTIALQKFMNLP